MAVDTRAKTVERSIDWSGTLEMFVEEFSDGPFGEVSAEEGHRQHEGGLVVMIDADSPGSPEGLPVKFPRLCGNETVLRRLDEQHLGRVDGFRGVNRVDGPEDRLDFPRELAGSEIQVRADPIDRLLPAGHAAVGKYLVQLR